MGENKTSGRKTVATVDAELHDHLKCHELKVDPKLHDLHVVVMGQRAEPGLLQRVINIENEIAKIKASIKEIKDELNDELERRADNDKWLMRLVAGTLVAALLNLVIKIP